MLDYFLPAAATGPVTIEILDGTGEVVRTYSSDDRPPPDPARDLEGYNRRCQENPSTAYCGTPLYWPAPAMLISNTAGMHRFSWDMRIAPVTDDVPGGVIATGAVPGRSYPQTNAPWAPPGRYTVRLSAGGASQTQPLSVVAGPAGYVSAPALAQLNAVSIEMYRGAKAAQSAYAEGRALAASLEKQQGSEIDAFRAQVDSLAPAPRPQQGFGGFGGGAPAGPPTLSGTSAAMLAAAMAMQRAETAPTAAQIAAAARARRHGPRSSPVGQRSKPPASPRSTRSGKPRTASHSGAVGLGHLTLSAPQLDNRETASNSCAKSSTTNNTGWRSSIRNDCSRTSSRTKGRPVASGAEGVGGIGMRRDQPAPVDLHFAALANQPEFDGEPEEPGQALGGLRRLARAVPRSAAGIRRRPGRRAADMPEHIVKNVGLRHVVEPVRRTNGDRGRNIRRERHPKNSPRREEPVDRHRGPSGSHQQSAVEMARSGIRR